MYMFNHTNMYVLCELRLERNCFRDDYDVNIRLA